MTQLTVAESAQIAEFENFRIPHPNLIEVDRTLCDLIEHPAGAAAYLVMGPTGVGKTTLIERVVRGLHNGMADELRADPGRYSSLVMRTPASSGAFSWKDFFMRGLAALEEPELRAKQPRARSASGANSDYRSVDSARWAFEDAVRMRRPKAVILDEGSHLTTVGSGVALAHQLDVIKSLSDATESVFVIVGTYDLIKFRNLSGQLGRRCRDVYFRQYRLDIEDQAKIFRNIINTFQRKLPVDSGDLLADAEYLYVGSAGCVGILKQWLDRALVGAFLAHSPLTHELLVETRLPTQSLLEISSEIARGERATEETDEDLDDLRVLLGLEPATPPHFERKSDVPRTGRRGRVGKRNPTADPVGVA